MLVKPYERQTLQGCSAVSCPCRCVAAESRERALSRDSNVIFDSVDKENPFLSDHFGKHTLGSSRMNSGSPSGTATKLPSNESGGGGDSGGGNSLMKSSKVTKDDKDSDSDGEGAEEVCLVF